MTSLLPASGVWSFARSAENSMPFALGNQFKALGYDGVYAFHNHTYDYYERQFSHPNLGYTYLARGNGLDMTETWPESDLELMEACLLYTSGLGREEPISLGAGAGQEGKLYPCGAALARSVLQSIFSFRCDDPGRSVWD